MFTICILFTTLTTKTFDKCEGAPNNPQTPRIIPRQDHALGFEIPGSATVLDLKATDFDKCLSHIGVDIQCLWGRGGCGESPPKHV